MTNHADAEFDRLRFAIARDDRPARLRQLVLGAAIGGSLAGRGDWPRVAVGEVAHCVLGKMLDRSKHTTGTRRPYLRNINVRWGSFDLTDLLEMFFEDDELDRYGAVPGDVLICEGGEPGRAAVWIGRNPMLIQKAIHRVRPGKDLSPQWLVMNLRHDTWSGALDAHLTGATIKHFTGRALAAYPIPLPPLAEQKRIVVRVDELMKLIDDLEAKKSRKRETQTRFRTSALDALTKAEGPKELAAAWKRLSGNFEEVVGQLEGFGLVRQTLRELAITGRLGTQHPQDRPAAELLDGDVSHEGETQNIAELPPGWVWTTAGAICASGTVITYGVLKPVWVPEGVPTVRVKDIQNGVLAETEVAHCSEERASLFRRTQLRAGDLVIAKDGATLGKTAFVPVGLEGGNVTQHVLRFAIAPRLDRQFVRLVIDSPHGQRWMKGETRGVALPGVNVEDFRRMPIPLPPLSEQRRIVAKVEALMKLCDELEAKLRVKESAATRLADAIVKELVA